MGVQAPEKLSAPPKMLLVPLARQISSPDIPPPPAHPLTGRDPAAVIFDNGVSASWVDGGGQLPVKSFWFELKGANLVL